MQENDLQQRTSTDFSNYYALAVTLRNRGWRGLTYDLNYTFSKSLDQGGKTQGFINGFDDSFNPNAMYRPSYFDRTHVFNGTFNYNDPLARPLGPTDFIDATNAANFGVISNSFTPAQRQAGSRWVQLGLRIEF